MRITKVAFAFFSIGFLAGSFERAAGLADPERPKRTAERHVEAAIARGTKLVLASVGSFGSSLPEELFARSLAATDPMLDGVAAALPGFEGDTAPADGLPVLTTTPPLNPDLHRHGLFSKRMLSEPDALAMSRMPAPKWMSVPLAEAWDDAPPATDIGGAREPRQDAATQDFIMPFERGRITSGFNQGRRHPAIDFAGALGSPVHATTRRQRVIFAGWRGGYGNAVIARDDFGRQHLYGHLQSIVARVGSLLDQGQVLGRLGSTGHSTGPHVHYEVRAKAGGHVNPLTLLFPNRRVGRGFAWNGARSVTPRVVAQAQIQPRPR